MSILILGHARHGKDTVAKFIEEYTNLKFISSSEYCAEHIIFPQLKKFYNYKNWRECYRDRSNHRAEWYDIISNYNSHDKARLAKSILKENNIYVGMRSSLELKECIQQSVFKYIMWVEDPRKDHESIDSMNISLYQIEYPVHYINNNKNLDHLRNLVFDLLELLKIKNEY